MTVQITVTETRPNTTVDFYQGASTTLSVMNSDLTNRVLLPYIMSDDQLTRSRIVIVQSESDLTAFDGQFPDVIRDRDNYNAANNIQRSSVITIT